MDPNRTLAFLIEWATSTDPADDAISAAEHLLALDRWMSQGGFLPSVWQHGRSLGSQANAHSPQNLPQPGHDSRGEQTKGRPR